MKMKTSLSIAIFVAVVLAFSANVFADDFDWLHNWEGVELTLSSHTGPTTDAYAVLCREFEELTGAKVTVIDESWTDLLVKHLAAFVAGTGEYDILTFPYIWFGHYAEGMMVENLDEWFAREDLVDPNYGMDDFVPAILDAYGRYTTGFTPDPEALWSVPYKFDIYLAQYRTDLFEEAGIVDADGVAKEPETWDELHDSLQKLQEAFPDISPLSLPLAISDPMAATFVPILACYGGDAPSVIYDENVYPLFHGPAGVEAVTMLKDLLPFQPPDALSFDYDMVNAQMAQGMAAYAINWNAYLPVLLDPTASVIHEDVAFALTPGGPEGRYQGLGGWQMGISVNSRNKEAAFQLLQFLSGKTKGVELALEGGSVARYSVAQNPEVIEAFPFYPLLIEALSDVAMRGTDRSWTEVEMALAVGLNEILLGTVEPEEGLVATAREVFDIARAAGYNPEESGPRP